MIYYVDGFTIRSNPSLIGGGFTIMNERGIIIKREERQQPGFTNNEGELLGIAHACVEAHPGDTIISDSRIAVKWVERGKSGSRFDLKDICLLARELIHIKQLKVLWEGRETNLAGQYNDDETRTQGAE